MRRRRGSMILLLMVVFAVGAMIGIVGKSLNAERRIYAMVKERQIIYEQAAHQLLDDGEVLEVEDIESIYAFDGEHKMVEFMIDADWVIPPAQYYGFYYSPDDVPLAFQNINVVLNE